MNKDLLVKDYYLGLDCGTSSVGWAVTDVNYNLLKFNGKDMWGSHLFDEAETAKERRTYRCARRRRKRQVQRIKLLQQIFAEEICKVDPTFFIRLNDSKYISEDKTNPDCNILFNDINFKDKDFFKKYPTIYHLRSNLVHNGTDDIRFLYLAISHILKHRGHFLFPGEDYSAINDLSSLTDELSDLFNDVFQEELSVQKDVFKSALKEKNKSERRKKLKSSVFSADNDAVQNIVKILCGNEVKTDVLFQNDEYEDLPEIKFKKTSFESEDLPKLEGALALEEFRFVQILKAFYDWALLSDIMNECQYISDAKIKIFDRNREDLVRLKRVIRKYCSREEYNDFFHGKNEKDKEGAFSRYIGINHDSHASKVFRVFRVERGSVVDFYGSIKKILSKCDNEDSDVLSVKTAIEEDNFMLLLSSYRNGKIPYQVNKIELESILEKASQHFPFLNIPDGEGYTPKAKILSLLTFRIPYYVGPLGNCKNSQSQFAWMHRKNDGRILPWNFDKMVDLDFSSELFITRMTNKCTYCVGEDVLPKNSLTYSKYLVLSELNNIKIMGHYLPVELKQNIYNGLFKSRRKVTVKSLVEYLKREGLFSNIKKEDVSGLESDFKSSLGSYLDFKSYLETNKLSEDDVDLIIKWITIFPEGGNVVYKRIKEKFHELSEEDITGICRLKYSGWGRFSKKFLCEIFSPNHETGELMSVLDMMWNSDRNLMQLMTEEYDDKTILDAELNHTDIRKLNYETVVKNLYASPAVKRQVWQTLRVVDEIEKIMKHPPKKVFIETTRHDDVKGEKGKKASRHKQLSDLIKDALNNKHDEYANDFQLLKEELEKKSESDVSIQDKLYLYFTQCGKCMYTGKPIDIEDLYNTDIYNIDHIYPFSISKDNSLTNRVLVLLEENQKKDNVFPIRDDIRKEMGLFWKMLRDRKFISDEKYNRLVRSTPLDESDLKKFINRQLDETSKNTKITKDILKQYFGDDSRIVFSKASNVSEFRKKYKIVKCRTLNDLHHAKDAYLNIVVGNVYDTKYTEKFFLFSDKKNNFDFSKTFDYDVEGAWKVSDGETIQTVKRNVYKNSVIYTKHPLKKSGKIYKLQPVPKGKGDLPLKTTDRVIKDLLSSNGDNKKEAYDEWLNKYGGYNSLFNAYFSVVQYEKKGKKYIKFVKIPIIESKDLSDEKKLIRYCESEFGLSEIKIICRRFLINSVVEIDGFKYRITDSSSGGDQIILSNCLPLIISKESEKVLKKIESFLSNLGVYKNLKVNQKYINENNTMKLFEELVDKSKLKIYSKRCNNKGELLQSKDAKSMYKSLSLEDRCSVINQLMIYYGMGNGCADLTKIGGTKTCGTLTKGTNIDLSKTKIRLISQSVTGLFENLIFDSEEMHE